MIDVRGAVARENLGFFGLVLILELGLRLGDDNRYSLWLWPVVAFGAAEQSVTERGFIPAAS
jgi:hypothetical protein